MRDSSDARSETDTEDEDDEEEADVETRPERIHSMRINRRSLPFTRSLVIGTPLSSSH